MYAMFELISFIIDNFPANKILRCDMITRAIKSTSVTWEISFDSQAKCIPKNRQVVSELLLCCIHKFAVILIENRVTRSSDK